MTEILLRTGVDMVDVNKLTRMIELTGEEFLDSSWTRAERLYCAGRPERLASRWAAKEATMKALGQGVGQISLLEIEVTADEGEMPDLVLRGNALDRAQALRLETWSVSLTHEDRWALAFVVGVGSTPHGQHQ
ncbi:holo-ACP synthase [Umezawaea sp. Da 62-37]|uniref:holo-ACP synthase n=1 Tax=Umezawaea sp. Da 62-37 TaxID=3075927 RepID=UPI0028F6F121|nr:holo-ACP synthase [Umezawaea sp. Da 62-37]WNV82886.1 holo-ACP synthase [Umezawaea sp. Da 62-37]